MRAVQRGSVVPLSEQIRQALVAAIENGELLPDQQLPTESQLAGQFGVSLAPVRTALGQLEQAGAIRKVRGRGSFVAPHAPSIEIGATPSIIDALRRSGEPFSIEMTDRRVVDAPQWVCAEHHEPVVRTVVLQRLVTVRDTPSAIAESWFPYPDFADLLEAPAFDQDVSLSDYLRQRHGIDHAERRGRVALTAAEPDVGAMLDLPLATPLLEITVISATQGRVGECARITYRPSAFQFTFR